MMKRIPNIQLVKGPPLRYCNRQDQFDGGKLDHRDEGIIIINVKALFESLGNKMGFVTINRAIDLVFHFINLLTINEVVARFERNEVLRLVVKESLILGIHHYFSMDMASCRLLPPFSK
jgi:hypothetical protein